MLKQQIFADQIHALKNQDQEKLSTLRYILAQIKNKEIDKRADLTKEETISVLSKIAKELNESIEACKKGKRQDLVSQYQNQLKILTFYLPKELTDEQLEIEIKKIIDKNQDLYQKNKKALIGIAVKELKSRANPAKIARMII